MVLSSKLHRLLRPACLIFSVRLAHLSLRTSLFDSVSKSHCLTYTSICSHVRILVLKRGSNTSKNHVRYVPHSLTFLSPPFLLTPLQCSVLPDTHFIHTSIPENNTDSINCRHIRLVFIPTVDHKQYGACFKARKSLQSSRFRMCTIQATPWVGSSFRTPRIRPSHHPLAFCCGLLRLHDEVPKSGEHQPCPNAGTRGIVVASQGVFLTYRQLGVPPAEAPREERSIPE